MFKIFKALCATILLLGVTATLWLCVDMKSERNRVGENRTSKVVIGHEVYIVPEGYIWGGYSRVTTSENVNFNILYPGAEARRADNNNVYDSPGWSGARKINFVLISKEGMHFMERYESLRRNALAAKTDSVSNGWTQISDGRDHALLTKNIDTRDIYIACYQKTDMIKYPSCSKYFELTDKTYVYFTFSRDRLDEWQEIELELFNLLTKFKIKD